MQHFCLSPLFLENEHNSKFINNSLFLIFFLLRTDNNALEGSIPKELANLELLRWLHLREFHIFILTQFSGYYVASISLELFLFSWWYWLNYGIDFNSLSGIVPPEMVNLLDYAIDHGNFRICKYSQMIGVICDPFVLKTLPGLILVVQPFF